MDTLGINKDSGVTFIYANSGIIASYFCFDILGVVYFYFTFFKDQAKCTNRENNLSSFGFKQRRSQSRAKGESFAFEARDVVSNCREPWRESEFVSRTP
jgi:hypothetical protein